MRIDILHVPDCPNVGVARSRVRIALDRTHIDAPISEVEVGSFEGAARTRMAGSPTILVDGTDPFAAGVSEPSMSCRRYRTEAGIDGAPSVEQLAEALSVAAADTARGEGE